VAVNFQAFLQRQAAKRVISGEKNGTELPGFHKSRAILFGQTGVLCTQIEDLGHFAYGQFAHLQPSVLHIRQQRLLLLIQEFFQHDTDGNQPEFQ